VIAFANGAFVTDDHPCVLLRDRGFSLGDGLFETVLVVAGQALALGRHHARLSAGAAALSLPRPPDEKALRDLCAAMSARSGFGAARAAVRLVWTAGIAARGLARDPDSVGGLYATIAPAPEPQGPLRAMTSQIRRNETAPSARWKTLSYVDSVEARREAVAHNCDEAILLNTQGRVACAAAANVFLALDGAIVTPPTSEGALPGTMRAALLESGLEISIRPVSADDLAQADGMALTNALNGVLPVSAIDGRQLDPGHLGIARLAAAVEN